MKFVAFGDSFTAGYSKNCSSDEARQISFVNQFKNYTDRFSDYENLAEAGSSNLQIAYSIYNWLKNNNPTDCFVFIGWTTFVRNTKWIDNEYTRDGQNNKFQFFKKTNLEKIFLSDNIKKQIFDTERDIFAISKILELKKIPFCMIQAFDDYRLVNEHLINTQHDFPNWIEWKKYNNTMMDICLDRYLKDVRHDDYGKNHKEFNVQNCNNLTKCLHPNKDGHNQIAKVLIDKILNIAEGE